MKLRSFLRLITALTAFASLGLAQPAWMSDSAAILGKKSLNEIVLPGAHDAGTYAIDTSKTSGIRLGGGNESSPDNKQVKKILSFGPVFSNWAKTQERTMAQMLDDGIRYFDLRVCVDARGVLMTCHGLYGASVESMLDELAAFLRRNPREVVLLGFNHFWDREFQISKDKKSGEIEGLRPAKWTELVGLLRTKLDGRLVSSKKFTPVSRLNELWALKSNNQVIALFDTDDVPDDEFIWKRLEVNTWVKGWDIDVYKAGTLSVLEKAKAGGYEGKFWAIRSSVTPDETGDLISRGFYSKVHPKTVSELADQTNPVVLGWIKNEWAGKYPMNLIWADFYNRADLVKLARHLNGIKVDFTGSTIGGATNWSKWKNGKTPGKK